MPQVRYEFIFDDNGVIIGVNKINDAIGGTSKTAKEAEGAFTSLWNTAKSVGLTLGAYEGFNFFKQLTQGALDFQDKMANVNSILGSSTISSSELGHQLTQLGGEFGSASELATALYEAIGAGIPAAESIQFVTEATKLAKATLADTGETTKLLAIIYNAYGQSINDVAHDSEIFARTVNDGIVRGEELAHSLGGVINTAALLKVPLEEVAAAITTMTRVGLNAEEAVTALNQTMLTFLKPTDKAKSVAKEFGVELSAAAIQSKGLAGAIGELAAKVDGNAEATALMFRNVRGLKGELALTGEQAGFFTAEVQRMHEHGTLVNDMFEKQNDTINRQLTIAWNNLDHAVSDFINTSGKAGSVGSGVTAVLKEINSFLERGADKWDAFAIAISAWVQNFQALIPVSTTLHTLQHDISNIFALDLRNDIDDMGERMRKATFTSVTGLKDVKDASGGATVGVSDLQKEIDSLVSSFGKQELKAGALEGALATLQSRNASTSEIVRIFGKQADDLRDSLEKQGEKAGVLTTKIADLYQTQLNATQAQKDHDKATKDFLDSVNKMSGAIEEALRQQIALINGGYRPMNEEVVKLHDLLPTVTQAQLDFKDSMKEAETQAPLTGIAEVQAVLDVEAAEYRQNQAALDHRTAQKKALDEYLDRVRDTTSETELAWAQAFGSLTDGLAHWVAGFDYSWKGLVDIVKNAASQMLESFIKGLLSPLQAQLEQLGASLAKTLIGFATGGSTGSIVTQGTANGAGTTTATGGLSGLTNLLTNPWTIAAVGGALAVTAWLKSQAHWEANTIVKNIENPFWTSRGQILPTDQLDELRALPADEAERIGESYKALNDNYLQLVAQFRTGGSDEDLVGRQSLNNTQPHATAELDALRQAVTAGGGIPKFKLGGYVEQTGLIYAHRGERITPEYAAGDGNMSFGSIIGSMHVYSNSSDSKAVARDVAREVFRQALNNRGVLARDFRKLVKVRGVN